MKRLPSILVFIATACMSTLFWLPMWRITLQAPQYPVGVSMYIWINKIGGMEPGVLQNINILNHYVGMKMIEPDSIPELTYFPIIIAILIGLGLLVALMNKKWLYLSFALILIIISALGMYDFYLWEYDYGHDISDDAPIVIEGMVYQPPLIGTKVLLNFIATSMPASGGYLWVAAILLSCLAWFIKFKRKVKMAPTVLFLGLLTLSSCSIEPVEINYGSDQCNFCRMSITDSKFSAEIVNSNGKAFKYDALECLIKDKDNQPNASLILTSTYNAPGKLMDVEKAHYLVSESLPSPMGANLSAYDNMDDLLSIQKEKGGNSYNWQELLTMFAG